MNSAALLSGLRRAGDEAQLTQALASLLRVDDNFAAGFLRLVVDEAARHPVSISAPTSVTAEEVSLEGRFDLRFQASATLDVIVELKIHAGYGPGQLHRYLRALNDVEHAYLVAITRDVPLGEPAPGEHPRWLGSIRWRELLPGLRALPLEDQELARQWPLFLDVLEEEGSMGFTRPQSELFVAWGLMRQATAHVEEFVEAVRWPVIEALREALGGGDGTADFYRSRAGRPVLSRGKWGKADMPIRIPADGPIRLRVGLFGYNPPTRFYVAPDNGRRWLTRLGALPVEGRHAVEALLATGEFRDYDLHAFYELSDERLASETLEEDVVAWTRARFEDVVRSGLLAAELPARRRGERNPDDEVEGELEA